MTENQIKDVMKFHLNNFNDEKEVVDDNLILNRVLSTTDGFGAANSAAIFRAVMRWTFKKNGHKDRAFPRNWLDMSVADLASRLIVFLLITLAPFMATAQLQVDINTVKTENKNNAIEIGISYVKALDSLFKLNDILIAPSNNSLFALTPEFDIRTGSADAFSSITAKMTGMLMTFGTTEVSGIKTPNTSKGFSVFPVSLGVETHNKFNTLNVLAEIGYVPWYQVGNAPDWIKRTKIGFFLQAGYKMNWDSTSIPIGGQIDMSKEEANEGIFRFKSSAAANLTTPINLGGTKVGLVGSGDIWFDLANKATYYRYDATVRFYLSDQRYLDLIYQKGSGAPNFNQGSQYGVGLTLMF